MLYSASDYHIQSQFDHTIETQPGKTLSMRFKGAFEVKDESGFSFNNYFFNPELALTTKKSSEKYSFGKEERILFKDNQLPGPSDVSR